MVVGTQATHAQTATTVNKTISSGRLHTVVVRDDGTVWQWGYFNSAPMQVTGLSGVVSVATAYDVSYALKSDGTVWTWNAPHYAPTQVSGLSNVVGIYAGFTHVAVVKGDGSVWTWGSNTYGQLGNGTTTDSSAPVQVSNLGDVVQVAAGERHTLALKSDGSVWSWGYNGSGELGNGTTTQSLTPVQVSGLTNAVQVTCYGRYGAGHSIALLSDNTVRAWGNNGSGQLGDGTNTNRSTPVQTNSLSGVVEVNAMMWGAMALKSNGTLWAWGHNDYGQLGDGTTTSRSTPVEVTGIAGVEAISGGEGQCAAIRSDGAVFAWGLHTSGQLGDDNVGSRTSAVEVPGMNDVASTAAGPFHALALKIDGTVWSWGDNSSGQLGDNTTDTRPVPAIVPDLDNVTAVVGGYSHSLALTSDGTAWGWGNNGDGQIGDGTWTRRLTPVQLSGLTGLTAITSKVNHCMALKSDGTVWAWGQNASGQLGDNSTVTKNSPVQVLNLTGVIAVAAGGSHSMALKSDGTVWAWGANNSGQLGDGTTTQSLTPVQVDELSDIVAIASGTDHCLAFKEDGTVWAWGDNSHGQLDDGTTTSRSTPAQVSGLNGVVSIGAGFSYSFAVKTDGTLWIKGNNWGGQLGDGNPDHKIVHVAGGFLFNAAVKESGTVITWGRNEFGMHGAGMPINPNPRSPVLVPGVNVMNDAPSVAITSPANNTSVALGQTQTVTVGFTPGDGTAESVSLYYHGILIGTDDSAPFTFNFTPWTWGDFELNAVGLDSNGVYSNRSSRIFIHTPYDSDSDTLPDWWEQKYFTTLAQTSSGDADGDGLTNAQELTNKTLPQSWDSDGDGYPDGAEIAKSTDPLDSGDKPVLTAAQARHRVSAGWAHTLAVRADGTVWQWGMMGIGSTSYTPTWLLGYGSFPSSENAPVQVPSLTDVVAVSAGHFHSLALKSDGTVWAWGQNANGQLGDGSTTAATVPVLVSGLTGVVAIAAGTYHSLAVKSDGTVLAWGEGGQGQLGDGGTTWSPVPVQATGLTDMVAVAAGERYSMALKDDGTVWAWGDNNSGQIGNGQIFTTEATPLQVPYVTGIVDIDCGYGYASAHSMAVKSDGTVWGWGDGNYGQLVDGNYTNELLPVQITGLSGVIAVDANYFGNMVLKGDGTVWAWGDNNSGRLGNGTINTATSPVQVTGLTNAVAIASSITHSVAVTSDGKLHTWGQHLYGQMGDDSTFVSLAPIPLSGVTSVTQIATGGAHAIVLKEDGTAWSWGYSPHWNPTYGWWWSEADPQRVSVLGSDVVAVAAFGSNSVAVKSDGSVWGWGSSGSYFPGTPQQINGFAGIVRAAAGGGHILALKSGGTVCAWGVNGHGQIGDDTTTTRATPVDVAGLSNVIAVAAGGGHSMALKGDGTVWAWGANYSGQLGDGTTTNRKVPIQITSLTGVVAIACGEAHSMALKSDGSLYVWGANDKDQLGDGTYANRATPGPVTGLSNIVAIGAGQIGSLAVRANGTMWIKGGGDSSYGHQGDGSTAHKIRQIGGGGGFTLALKDDGTMIAFGSGPSGHVGGGVPRPGQAWVPGAVHGLNMLYTPSTLSISSPSSSPATLKLGQTQTVTVSVNPGGSQPTTVSLYHQGVLVGTDVTAPYTFNFTPWSWGDFELRAVGTDSLGLQTLRSAPLTISVPYDSDSDSLPDWWELRQLGNLAVSGTDDSDDDSWNNLYEYTHGTSPVEYDYVQTPVITIIGGDEQRAAEGQVFTHALKVQVKKSGGAPIPYAKVSFAVDAGDSLLSSNGGTGWQESVELITDGNGYAEVWLFAGQTLGAVDITVTAGAATTDFSATVTEPSDSSGAPWVPGSGYIIGNQSRTGSLSPLSATGIWNVATTAQGFGGSSESVYWLPTKIGRSAVLEWIPDATTLQGVGDVSGIMVRLSDEITADQPFVFAGVRKVTSSPATYAVELAWRSEAGANLRRIANLDLPGGVFEEGMRFRLELVGGRVLLSCARPASPGFEPWEQRLAVDLGEEAIWKDEAVPAVFAGMAFASGSGSSASFVIGEHETRLEAERPGVRWWRVVEPAEEYPAAPESFRLGTQAHYTTFLADTDLNHEGPVSEPQEPMYWDADYWHAEAPSGQAAQAILSLENVIHPMPTEYVDVYWKAGPVDDDGVGADTARPEVTLQAEALPIELNQSPGVGGGSAENGTWVYLGRIPGAPTNFEYAFRYLYFYFDWALQVPGSAGSDSKLVFDGLLLVGGLTLPDANGNQIPDVLPSDSLLTTLGDRDGDGWSDYQEYLLGTDATLPDSGISNDLTFAVYQTPNPVPLPRGRWSPVPLAVKVTYDSAGTKPVRGYGVEFQFSSLVADIAFGETLEHTFPSPSLTVSSDNSGIAQAYVWTGVNCPIPSSPGTYQLYADSSVDGSGVTGVTFTGKPYDNHAPLAIDATSSSMALGRTSTFPFATGGNSLAAAGSWLASGDSGGITNLLPLLPNLSLPATGPAVILWRWNSYTGGSWEATQWVVPDSTSDDSFGALIAMDSNPDPTMNASAMLAVAAPEQGKVYLYALSQDGTAWRRWPSADAVVSTGSTNISSLALHGRWLAVGDATASSGRGEVDLFKFQATGSNGNLTWTVPTSPTQTLNPGGSAAQDAFGTSVSLSETGHRLVVGAPSSKDPEFPNVTGLADPSVYVYEPASGGSSWQQLTPTIQNTAGLATGQDWSDWARFGEAVLAVGDHVIVGSPVANGALTRTSDLYLTLGQPDGAVAAYRRNGSAWEAAGVHITPYLTFGWRLARGTDLVYAAARTLEVYMVGGNVVVTSIEDSDPLDPLSAFVKSFGFDTNDDLAPIPGGEIFPGSLYPDDVPLAADGYSVFVLHSASESYPDTFAEFRWLPEVSRSASLNATVAELTVQDLEWNNISATPFENINLTLTNTPSPWTLAGPVNGVWDLRVGSTTLLAASPPGLAFLEFEATDLAGEQHAELVVLKLSSSTLATPEILSGKWLSPTFVELAWSPAAADTSSYQFETAVLDGSPTPTFDEVAQIDGAVDLYQFEVVANTDGYQVRLRARRGDDVTPYSDIFELPYDTDSDGLPDWWEQMMGSNLNATDNPDGDGWDNATELANGTNPYAADSDGDGIPDHLDAEPLNRNSNVPGLVIHTVLEH